jgi:hypothetical protein
MTFDAQGGVLLDGGDPASKVARRISSHAIDRFRERGGKCGRAAAARILIESMRVAVKGQLNPKLCDARNAMHGGQLAEYWLTDSTVLVIVESVIPHEHGLRVLATCYKRSPKYLTPDEFAEQFIRKSGQTRETRNSRRLGWRPNWRRLKRRRPDKESDRGPTPIAISPAALSTATCCRSATTA